jgi:hypothetical protein
MTEKAVNKGGRPRHAPTDKDRAQVKALSAMGIPLEDIAIVMQISRPTLTLHYRAELDAGPVEANAKVAQSLFRQATDPKKPNVAASIFWMKARAGWSDRGYFGESKETPPERQEHPGKKVMLDRAARNAHEGTDWSELLGKGSVTVVQ